MARGGRTKGGARARARRGLTRDRILAAALEGLLPDFAAIGVDEIFEAAAGHLLDGLEASLDAGH